MNISGPQVQLPPSFVPGGVIVGPPISIPQGFQTSNYREEYVQSSPTLITNDMVPRS